MKSFYKMYKILFKMNWNELNLKLDLDLDLEDLH